MTFDPTKPVWTRNGKPARIVCTDLKRDDGRTIIANIDFGTWEDCRLYYPSGHNSDDPSGSPEDLINEAPSAQRTPEQEMTDDEETEWFAYRFANLDARLDVLHDNVAALIEELRGMKRLGMEVWNWTQPGQKRTPAKGRSPRK